MRSPVFYTLSLHDALPISCLPISMNSVTNLRDALKHLSQAGLVAEMLGEPQIFRSMPRLASDFITLAQDRKSTRLNSSHMSISYAVFCLKKKKIPDADNY